MTEQQVRNIGLAQAARRAVQPFVIASLLVALAGIAVPQSQRPAADPHAGHRHAAGQGETQTQSAAAMPTLPDTEVVDQDGRRLRFYTDLVRGKVVAINFVYTTCTSVCPRAGQNFSRLQALLGERLGRDVHLISISTDPDVDTPERMREWGARFGRRSGWTLVTGEPVQVRELLRVLTGSERGGGGQQQGGNHTPLLLMGNDARREWRSAFGLAPAHRLLRTLTSW